MDILIILTISGATIGSCYYFRKETKEQLEKLDSTLGRMEREQRDFHGRLCTLEERYHQLLERMWESRK